MKKVICMSVLLSLYVIQCMSAMEPSYARDVPLVERPWLLPAPECQRLLTAYSAMVRRNEVPGGREGTFHFGVLVYPQDYSQWLRQVHLFHHQGLGAQASKMYEFAVEAILMGRNYYLEPVSDQDFFYAGFTDKPDFANPEYYNYPYYRFGADLRACVAYLTDGNVPSVSPTYLWSKFSYCEHDYLRIARTIVHETGLAVVDEHV